MTSLGRSPGELTINELAEKVLAITGSRSEIKYLPLPTDDPQQRQPDINMAIDKLGWRPKVSLDDGLKQTIAYFDRLMSGVVEEIKLATA
jgi:UDP-glucuronate decarboxylase